MRPDYDIHLLLPSHRRVVLEKNPKKVFFGYPSLGGPLTMSALTKKRFGFLRERPFIMVACQGFTSALLIKSGRGVMESS